MFALCYKDSRAKLYCITEPAPLKAPRDKNKLAEYEAEKAAYIARWKPIVDAAYEKSRKKVRSRTFSVRFPYLIIALKQDTVVLDSDSD